MVEPTERTLWLLVAVGVVGALGVAVPAVGLAAPFALAGLALLFVVDVVLAGAPGSLTVRRALPPRCVERRPSEFGLVVGRADDAGRGVLDVELTDTLPGADEPWVTARTAIAPGEVVTLTAPRVFPRRGRHRAGRVALRTLGPLGLARRRERRVVDDDVVVAVDLGAVVAHAERLVRSAGDAGARRRRSTERGRELDALRDYRRGDDVRLVDWKATARVGSLVVKELVPETRQDVVVVLDAGRQLCGRQRDVTDERTPAATDDGSAAAGSATAGSDVPRFVLAERAALVLAAAALQGGDRVGLLALADDVVAFVPPIEGRAQLKRIADATAAIDAAPVEPPYQELPSFLAARLKRRALVLIVTDVVDEASARALAQGLGALRGRHVVVVVALGDPALRRLASAPADADDPLGARVPDAAVRLLDHRRRALAALEAAGAIVVDAPAGRAAAAAVDAWLAVKARGRL